MKKTYDNEGRLIGVESSDRVTLTTTIGRKTKQRLEAESLETDVPMSRIIDKAVKMYFDRKEK